MSSSGAGARTRWLIVVPLTFALAILAGVSLRRSRHNSANGDQAWVAAYASGFALIDSGRHLDAFRKLSIIPDDVRLGTSARYQEGVALRDLHLWQQAEATWNAVLDLDPQMHDSLWKILDAYFVEQRFDDARNLVLRIHAVHKDQEVRVHMLLELIRQEFERLSPGDAITLIEPVVSQEPGNIAARRCLGLAYFQVGRISEGLAIMRRAVDEAPSDGLALEWLLATLHEVGRHDDFHAVVEKAPADLRARPAIEKLIAMVAEAENQLPQAIQSYERALAKDPHDRKTQYLLGNALERTGKGELGQKHRQIAVELDEARERLAACYTQSRRFDLRPPRDLMLRIAETCEELGRKEEAIRWRQEADAIGTAAARQNPSSP